MSTAVDVLLVEDEVDLAQSTVDYLYAFGITVQHVTDAEEAMAAFEESGARVVLVDVGLPGMSGFALCSQLKTRHPGVVVLFLSARTTEADQILGLELGADDYLPKPFSPQVLVAKVRRALERTGRSAPQAPVPPGAAQEAAPIIDDGRLRIDLEAGRTWVDGAEVHLTTIEHRILDHLARNQGRVCSKQQIIDAVWDDPFTSEGTLTVHVRRLRTRIEADPDNPVHVRTVWGRGYLFEASS
ncbi:response regulator transcription factor [Schaalia sp. 19OD2882]|uniref:response regulator transcription factor n=1 Tax=Schaalia sp. 19OD2882 TaxID=2794089 RepID=UPI001C1EE98C|nr:response regulator transcription factor [Schaalia sp. 19OD2882]QWW19197.1 response regulator transcription factor [Schaalia sp. 19OD2882]